MELHLTSVIPPSVNHYLSYRAIIKNGKPTAISYASPETLKYKKEFKKYLEQEVKKQNWNWTPNKSQHFYVDAVFYFDQLKRDCNNYFKVLLDAITDTHLIWPDDNVVLERVERILYDNKNPRIELTIKPVEYIGIFDSSLQLENFVSRCVDCTRYSRNCSILKKAKIGRIQEEIDRLTCTKFKQRKAKSKRNTNTNKNNIKQT